MKHVGGDNSTGYIEARVGSPQGSTVIPSPNPASIPVGYFRSMVTLFRVPVNLSGILVA